MSMKKFTTFAFLTLNLFTTQVQKQVRTGNQYFPRKEIGLYLVS